MTFALDGKSLTSDYDDVADILYLWVDGQQAAVTHETADGHLVQLDPDTREFVGVAIVDYKAQWEGSPITIEVPVVEQRVLELV